MATDSSQKLMAIAAIVSSEGTGFVNPSVYFRPIAHPHSNNPATNRYIHAIFPPPLLFSYTHIALQHRPS
ncbi:MAG: hypothetical protein N0E58_22075, partial [Candidatus Thiodiazotropha endolucinida]|nr:hypothetical protein [Candidatus Thiodiazotropha taylori]MCW4238941.1 hypothetical protein [Candidatus Thiodiazotropha endolucinida]